MAIDVSRRYNLDVAPIESGDYFGIDVAVHGDTVVVGAHGSHGGTNDEDNAVGKVYVCRIESNDRILEAILAPADGEANDYFGYSVSIFEDTIAVGAIGNGIGGAVYIFRRDGTTWTQETKIATVENNANFGKSVSLYGGTLAVGATHSDQFTGNDGAVFLYKYNNGTWNNTHTLGSSKPISGGWFGNSVSLEDRLLVVGELHGLGSDETTECGAVTVFELDNDDWIESARLVGDDNVKGNQFGVDVDISNSVIVVGQNHFNTGDGSVSIYKKINGIWSRQDFLSDSTLLGFGYSVAIHKEILVVGVPVTEDEVHFSGKSILYEYIGEEWTEKVRYIPEEEVYRGFFGYSVAIGDNLIAVSEPTFSGVGKAYAYTNFRFQRIQCDYINTNTIQIIPKFQDLVSNMISPNYGKYVIKAGSREITIKIDRGIIPQYFDGIDILSDKIGVK